MNAADLSKEAATAYQLIIYIYSASVVLTSLEYLSISSEFSDRGYYSWRLFGITEKSRKLSARFQSLQRLAFARKGMVVLLLMRLGAAIIAAISPFKSWQQWIALASLALLSCTLSWRQKYGEDGADQMTLIVGITSFLVVGPFQHDSLLIIGIWFIALQAMLSYLSAGIAKAIAPVWRMGSAVAHIVDTASYGSVGAGEFLRRHPGIGKAATWGTIIFEVTFPVMIFLPWPAPGFALAAGVAFHVGIALVMGLNDFVPAFISTYPALFFVSQITG